MKLAGGALRRREIEVAECRLRDSGGVKRVLGGVLRRNELARSVQFDLASCIAVINLDPTCFEQSSVAFRRVIQGEESWHVGQLAIFPPN